MIIYGESREPLSHFIATYYLLWGGKKKKSQPVRSLPTYVTRNSIYFPRKGKKNYPTLHLFLPGTVTPSPYCINVVRMRESYSWLERKQFPVPFHSIHYFLPLSILPFSSLNNFHLYNDIFHTFLSLPILFPFQHGGSMWQIFIEVVKGERKRLKLQLWIQSTLFRRKHGRPTNHGAVGRVPVG